MTDTFTARLVELRLTSAVREMATSIIQTSGSPAITEAKDFSTALFDAGGALIAFGGYAAFHVGAAIEGLRAVRALFPDTDIAPGDAFLVNDPYTSGALHVGDVGIVWPVFLGESLIAWSYANAHQTDIGGVSPGGLAAGAAECFAEGLMFPPTRVITNGHLSEEWRRFIANNVRTPVNVIGDIRSLMAASRTAERRVLELVQEFGLATVGEANAMNHDSSEQVLRRRLASLPRATVGVDEWLDYERDGELSVHHIAIQLTTHGDRAVFDVSGSGDQAVAPINTCRAAVVGSIYLAVAQKLAWDLPMNEGLFRPVEIELGRPGTLVNARKPAANSIGHVATGARLVRGVSSLLTQLLQASDLPELRAQVAGTAADGLVRGAWVGRDLAGRNFAFLGQDQTPGLGARAKGDGLDVGGLQFGLGIEITDVELAESLQPVLYLWRRLSANSGGAGFHRGGLGVDLAWTPHGTEAMMGTLFCTASRFPGCGELRGFPGSTGFMGCARGGARNDLGQALRNLWRNAEQTDWAALPSYGAGVRLLRGDVVRVWSPGGGGLGDPAQRQPERVLADVAAGRITRQHATAFYRLDAASPEAADHLQHPLGRKGADGRVCGFCNGDLGRWSQPLDEHVRIVDSDLVELFSAAQVRIKDDIPGRLLRARHCRHCDAVLDRSIAWDWQAGFVASGRGCYVPAPPQSTVRSGRAAAGVATS